MSQKKTEFKNVRKVLCAFLTKVLGEETVKKYCPLQKRNSAERKDK
ncbi:hypothetical protein bcgnr5390_17630 [Bacillus luti]|nr:hypothetical protein BC2903_61800 [Bacillus cereus]